MTTPDIRLLPKSDDEVARWLPVAMDAYEHARLDAGDTAEGAHAARRTSEQQFFPDGKLVEGHFLFTVVADDEEAGWLWLGPSPDGGSWWIWDVAVHAPHRGRGIGRATMLLAEEFARSQGATTMRLNVFADNTPAIALYDSLGYETASMHKQKRL